MLNDKLPTLYKFLTAHDCSREDDSPWKIGRWRSVETAAACSREDDPPWKIGRWRSVNGVLMPYKLGLRAAPIWSLSSCLSGARLYLYRVEVGAEQTWSGRGTPSERVFARRMRLVERIEAWNDRTARLFAADCAEHVLPIYETAYPGDSRPRVAIEMARRYANGQATEQEVTDACAGVKDAAGAAGAAWGARAALSNKATWIAWGNKATWAAARAADSAASIPVLSASFYAWDAAGDAVNAAAWHAADTAMDAECQWQARRLADTARDAECQWQARRLAELLGLPWEARRWRW